jgi:hypothetical protein
LPVAVFLSPLEVLARVSLGNPRGAAHLRQYDGKAGRVAQAAAADERAIAPEATLAELKAEGVTSANGPRALNDRQGARRQVDCALS